MWTTLITLTCLAGCAGLSSPPEVPPPVIVDINSEEFQNELAAERMAALQNASKSGTNVTRKFYVGWEMHGGYFLIPLDAPDDWVSPDFLDDQVITQFDSFIQLAGCIRPEPKFHFSGKGSFASARASHGLFTSSNDSSCEQRSLN
jgi:hypothetical protein